MNGDATDDYVGRARAAFPGGWPGDLILPEEMSFVASRGEGSRLYDVDGRDFLDLTMGGGSLILGHAHAAVTVAVTRQIALGSHFYGLNDRSIELATILVDAIPCAERVRFASTGSEATFYCLRLARAFTGKEKILKFEGCYHGHNDYGMMSLAPALANAPSSVRADSAGIPEAIRDLVLIAPYNDADAACRIIDRHADELAAVIVEPLQRSIPPGPGFLEGLREATRQHDVLLVYDEVVTGFRLAYGGGQAYYGVVPDLAAYGKAIACGYPLAAVAGRADIMEHADPARKGAPEYVYVSGTLAGNPASAAASIATLAELGRPGVYERLHAIGRRFREALEEVFAEHGIPVQVNGEGPLFQIFFTAAPVTDYQSQMRADAGRFDRFTRRMFAKGVYMSRRAKNYLSLVHTDDDLDRLVTAARAVCREGLDV